MSTATTNGEPTLYDKLNTLPEWRAFVDGLERGIGREELRRLVTRFVCGELLRYLAARNKGEDIGPGETDRVVMAIRLLTEVKEDAQREQEAENG